MEETKMVYVVIERDGQDVGDYVDVPAGMDAEDYARDLMEDPAVKAVYETCTNAGPLHPYCERNGDSVVYHVRTGGFSYGYDDKPTKFAEAYRDFVSRFEAGKLAPLRLDGDEKEGKAYYAFPAMNGVYALGIKAGKVVSIALF